MLGLSAGEVLTILIVATVLFGAKRLPELGKNLGHGMRGFRDALRGVDEPEPRSHHGSSAQKAPETPRSAENDEKQSLGHH